MGRCCCIEGDGVTLPRCRLNWVCVFHDCIDSLKLSCLLIIVYPQTHACIHVSRGKVIRILSDNSYLLHGTKRVCLFLCTVDLCMPTILRFLYILQHCSLFHSMGVLLPFGYHLEVIAWNMIVSYIYLDWLFSSACTHLPLTCAGYFYSL